MPFLALFDSSLPPKLDDKLSDQLIGPLGANFPIIIILTIRSSIPKYNEKNL